jgi:DNA-binding response OmpR family regulator
MSYRIIIIEDEPQVAELLALILRHEDVEALVALDGPTGLALARQIRPDLIILDIMMPAMNGWQVYDEIRADDTLKQTPIIIESVLPERPERKQTFTDSHIDSYFTKPFDTTRLRREVERMLGDKPLWPPPQPRLPRSSRHHLRSAPLPDQSDQGGPESH